MSWVILVPTIIIAVIIGAAVLIKESPPSRITFGKRTAAAPPSSDPFPHLSAWFLSARGSRQPILPIRYDDLGNRVNRGMKVALLMVAAMLLFAAASVGEPGWVLVVVLALCIPFTGIGIAMSATHSLVLRMLPYRGPIVSTALGTLVGIAAALVLRDSPIPAAALIILGLIYGVMIGIIDHDSSVKSPEAAEKGREAGFNRVSRSS